MSDDAVSIRSKELLSFLNAKKEWLQYIVLAFIVFLGYSVRTKNLPLLKDVSTGNFIPVALDPFVILRYAKEVLVNGFLSPVDTLRYVPQGYLQIGEFSFISHFIASLFKVLSVFFPALTIEQVHVLYSPIVFSFSLVFFFLLVRRLFDWRIASLASAFLAFSPAYLYRTMAGFADKESLAMFFMFGALYFYIVGVQSSSLKKGVLFGSIAGFFTLLMGLTWGGVAQLFFVIGVFAFVELLFGRLTNKNFAVFSSWIFFGLGLLAVISQKFTFKTFLYSSTTLPLLLALIGFFVLKFMVKKNFFDLNSKVKNYLPLDLFYLFVSGVFLGFLMIIGLGFRGFSEKISSVIFQLTSPFASSRWALTVAESRQPYIVDWLSQFRIPSSFSLFQLSLFENLYFWLFLFGSVLLLYFTFKKFGKYRYHLTGAYVLFIFAFIFSRYSSSSVLNGSNTFSLLLYVGSLVAFGLFLVLGYIYLYRREKDIFENFQKADLLNILVLVWFVSLVIAARSAIRLLFVFAPITCILAAYFIFRSYDWAFSLKEQTYKVLALVLVFFLLVFPVYGHYQSVSSQAPGVGPSYGTQWQLAMDWVRQETPEDSVFAHWWDYGYWVQTGGERATLSDGGNARGAINHYTGRYLLTAPNNTDPLDFLYANSATHVLMISDEIGKYSAFSSIGADAFYDRFSSIPVFSQNPSLRQEHRNSSTLVFTGGFSLDDDLVYNGEVFGRQSAGIGGIELPLLLDPETRQLLGFEQPRAILVGNGKQIPVRLRCLYFNGELYEFDEFDYDACFRVIPRIDTPQQVDPVGAGLLLSKRVYPGFFARFFLFDEKSPSFTLVYDDSDRVPLSVYQGRLIGPLRIWEVNYPEGMGDKSFLREPVFVDNRVNLV